jgi:hypothetical protein
MRLKVKTGVYPALIMKTALSIVGIVFLVLLVLVGGFIGFVAYEGYKYDASSKAYVDESVPAIVTNWSKDELIKRESPQLRKAVSDDELTALFSKLSVLGSMQSYDDAKGGAKMNLTPSSGFQVTAYYVAEATFQNGKAEIKINLIQVDGAWLILGFHVNRPGS